MKRFLTFAAATLLLAGAANAQENKDGALSGTVSYSLPATVLSFDVEAERTEFFAGPYAKYAQKYLGIEVGQNDAVTYRLSSVRMTPYLEPDNSARFLLEGGLTLSDAAFLQMTSCGLVCCSPWTGGPQPEWRFPSIAGGDFSKDGMTSNVSSVSEVLYGQTRNGSAYDRIAVQQEVTVAKTIDKKAAETAAMIFSLRKKRIQIVTGDTDATYSGEAMGSALSEIAALEKEYMSMFVGYSEFRTQTMKCDVVPSKDNKSQKYIAFRLSDADGVVAADNVSGSPYILELEPQPIGEAAGRAAVAKGEYAVYRVPAICSVRLTDGVNPILQDRIAVYQLGVECYLPLGK